MTEHNDSEATSQLQTAQLVKNPTETVKEISGNKKLSRGKFTLSPGGGTIPSASSTQKASVTLLTSGTVVWILGSLAVSLLYEQLGISSIAAARIAAAMVAASVVALFIGLYVTLVRIRRTSYQPSLSELHLGDYRVRFKHHVSVGRILRLLLHLAWLALVAGIVLAIIAQTTVGCLASGAAVSAIALFLRRTVMPTYQLADQSSKQAKREYELARKR